MTYEEKLDLILKAIKEARKVARQGHLPKLYVNPDNKLDKIGFDDVHDILLKLQDDEGILGIKDIPTKLKDLYKQTDDMMQHKTYFSLDITNKFDPWYEKYVLNNKSKLANLDWINVLKIYDVMLDINEQLQLGASTTVSIHSLPQLVRFSLLFPSDSIGQRRQYQDYRMEGAGYLKKQGIILDYRYIDESDLGYGNIQIAVDLLKFEEFFQAVVAEYTNRPRRPSKEEQDDKKNETKTTEDTPIQSNNDNKPEYWITYKAREVVLNDLALIAKPDFNSENDLVFGFLYEHPNKKHSRAEIEKGIKTDINKDLHKVVENLGFASDLRKVFFDVTKDHICFRNPITKEDLERIGISKLKLPVRPSKTIL